MDATSRNSLTLPLLAACGLTALALGYGASPSVAQDRGCPPNGWAGSRSALTAMMATNAAFPTQDTARPNPPDCQFHEWSWEAFVWATAPVGPGGQPRFLSLRTPEDLLRASTNALQNQARPLRLGLRSSTVHGSAIVEADGNMLVGPNGHPVYASVHMNDSYFATARSNMIVTGKYLANATNDNYFNVGAAVFKATWLRLDPTNQPPTGAYTTTAAVPVLAWNPTNNTVFASAVTTNVTVALVGLHVVGYTVGHPEFLWATFEHTNNAPMIKDNQFKTNMSVARNYTFYKSGTSFSAVNLPTSNPQAPVLTFNASNGRFSPVTQVVQENATGGENNSPNGAGNIAALNAAAQSTLINNSGTSQTNFASYQLIGTVWMNPNTYLASITNNSALMTNATGLSSLAVGSVNLANSTAETFVQIPSNSNPAAVQVQNCFMCHNPASYVNPNTGTNSLPLRRIAISHVLSTGTNTVYGVPNVTPVKAIIPKSAKAPGR